ncbi:MAG: type 2 lantipeptide synthetase LanM [Pseudonocardiales bacterium]|nr:MAG: type 2 lantipeptide synthetase LanM [Pseudonocardiales bacterium]
MWRRRRRATLVGVTLPIGWWRLGCDPAERATTPPEWASFVGAALAGSSADPAPVVPAAEPAEALDAFLPVFSGLLRHSATRLGSLIDNRVSSDIAARTPDLLSWLGRRLTRLAARTLVRELHRDPAGLVGTDGEQRFAHFVGRAASPAGLADLVIRYPVLARVLATACLSATDAFAELAVRLQADRAAVTELADAASPLAAIDLGTGDAHQGGRTVAVLRFAGGSAVVYKPRPLSIQQHLCEILQWYSTKLGDVTLRTPVALTRDGYGWSEFVAAAPCADRGGVERFYRRQGALLALLYALDCTDIHLENLIAAGDEPVVVDVETLFHPSFVVAASTGPDPALDRLAASVARTGLLPIMVDGVHGRVDMSGLGGGAKQLRPDDVVDWVDAGTDTMRLVRRPAMSRGAQNRPAAEGASADPADYLVSLRAGFRLGYDAILRDRDALLALVQRCAQDTVRVVVRDTRFYAAVLDESTHPDVLADAAARQNLFLDALTRQAAHPSVAALLADEVGDLWAGDVPLFTARAGQRHVWSARGADRGPMLPVAPTAAIADKVASFGESDRFEQEWVLDASFAVRDGTPDHVAHRAQWARVDDSPDPDRLISRACEIGDQLVASACGDARRANWLGLELVDARQWMLMPSGCALGEGYCGIALFLAQLADLTGISRYRELAHRCLVAVPGLLERLADDAELAAVVGGGFNGLGGIAYALARLRVLLDEPGLREPLESAVRACGLAADSDDRSYGTGMAGALAALSSLGGHGDPLPGVDTLTRHLAGRLIDLDQAWDGPPGLLAGAAGPAWALGRHAEVSGEREALTAARRFAALDPPRADDPSWCHGLAGHAVASTAAGSDTTAAVAALDAFGPLAQSSLCHGELGVLESLLVLSQRGHTPAARVLRKRTAAFVGTISRRGSRCGTPNGVPTPGLLSGLAGIGYLSLRLAAPTTVPSALFLELVPTHTAPADNE